MNKQVLLVILDGWGLAQNKAVSAIDAANTPFVDALFQRFPHSRLQASGEAVGLPEGQMGNSEVGHMNIGAGRVVYQDLVRIEQGHPRAQAGLPCRRLQKPLSTPEPTEDRALHRVAV